jgi:hypothetical protein
VVKPLLTATALSRHCGGNYILYTGPPTDGARRNGVYMENNDAVALTVAENLRFKVACVPPEEPNGNA